MHLRNITLNSDRFPTTEVYPFNIPLFRTTRILEFHAPVTFFVGENGSGKSTLLKAIARRCGIHLWGEIERARFEYNPYEEELHRALEIEWVDGPIPGSFFASQTFRNFASILDEWASTDPGQLDYFGGHSLMNLSHGQSLMSYFRSRYRIRGLYFLDEPETALSPKSQLELLSVLTDMSSDGHAQFVIASHSPLLLACHDAEIYSFDTAPVSKIHYEDTEHYRVYRDFMENREKYLKGSE
ncbi:MAG: AAA family ATPase [Candidatus Latescibacterota bacterium]